MSKRLNALIRIIIAAVLFIAAVVTVKLVSMPWWGNLVIFIPIYILIAYDIFVKAVKDAFHGQLLDENLLMIIATVGAFVVREYPEAILVMWLYQIGELFQSYAVGKSRKSIASLMDIRPDTARVIRDGEELILPPDEVEIGDTVVVFVGEKIPLDGTITCGSTSIDTSALTGESLPKSAKEGDEVLSGCINLTAKIEMRAEKEFYDSTASKILDLVENAAGRKAKAENFITKFARWYTPIVVFAAIALAVVPSIFTGDWNVWVYRALSFLVASCPCALVISIPLGFFGGIGGASSVGVLVKGGNYLELLAKADTFVMDKTGTVTKGSFEVVSATPENKRQELLRLAAIAESASTHPIAVSILRAAEKTDARGWAVEGIAGKGVRATKDGETICVGGESLMRSENIEFAPLQQIGTTVYVAKDGEFVGSILLGDALKEGSRAAVEKMKADGCKTYMLTGDNERTARAVAQTVGIDEFKAELLPADKVTEFEKILERKKKGSVVAFVGDGINDAPVLTRADIGIAMGGLGSDSAIEAADVVLMRDDLGSIAEAKKTAKHTVNVCRENLVFALVVKAAVLVLSALGITNMWLAIFADVGVMILAVLNALRPALAAGRRVKKSKSET